MKPSLFAHIKEALYRQQTDFTALNLSEFNLNCLHEKLGNVYIQTVFHSRNHPEIPKFIFTPHQIDYLIDNTDHTLSFFGSHWSIIYYLLYQSSLSVETPYIISESNLLKVINKVLSPTNENAEQLLVIVSALNNQLAQFEQIFPHMQHKLWFLDYLEKHRENSAIQQIAQASVIFSYKEKTQLEKNVIGQILNKKIHKI